MPEHDEAEVRGVVESFYDAFNTHSFEKTREFVTDDWVHINPLGGCTRGREAVVEELKEVHSTFLKDVPDTPERVDVHFAAEGVAVATVPSRLSTFTTPDGMRFENPRAIRTFVVVRRGATWRILHDHNTLAPR